MATAGDLICLTQVFFWEALATSRLDTALRGLDCGFGLSTA